MSDTEEKEKLSEAEMIDILSRDYVIMRRTSTPAHGLMAPPDLSMSMKPAHGHYHKLSTFSGDSPGKGEVQYREWRYEVLCLRRDPEISEASVINSVRRSLRGTAKQLLIPLGEKADIEDILKKLDVFFGDISTNEMIMQEFFNAYQKPDESVTTFGCRLEMLLSSAVEHGYLEKDSKNDMLRHKFWQSLSSDKLKSQTRHKYDTIPSFDQLLAELRIVEKQIEITPGEKKTEKSKNAQHHAQVTHQDLKDLEHKIDSKLEKVSKDLNSKLDDKFNKILEKLDSSSRTSDSHAASNTTPYQGGGRGGYGRGRRYGRGGRRGRGQSRGRGQPQNQSN